MKKEDLFRTLVSGCLIESMMPLFGEVLDLGNEHGVVSTYAPKLRPNTPWRSQLLEDFELVSVHYLSRYSLRCLLSREGLTNIYGPGGKPDHTFQIPEAGVFGQQSKGYGYVSRIAAVDDGLYVCGDHRQFYRFEWDGANLASGRWVNMAASMRQRPVPDDAPQDPADFEAWLDAQEDSVEFRAIGGSAANDIYAAGDEVWHFNGQGWQQLALPTDEEINAIKVLDLQRVVMVGHNGTVLVGNANDGWRDLSSVDDNQNFTGVEYFQDQIWLSSNFGLFAYDTKVRKIVPYRTNLAVDLVDTHLLEAKDGVLWSFGYKDLAYWDSNNGNTQWVRVHHPDNPRVDEVQPQQASRRPPQAPTPEAQEALVQAQAAALGWLPKPQAGKLDIGGWMQRVGHSGVGAFVLEQLAPLGFKPQEVLRVNTGKRYTLAIPKQGVELELQCQNKSGKDGQHPERWGLAQVRLITQNVNPYNHWQGPWPGPIDPDAGRAAVLQRAAQLWGEPDLNNEKEQSYFVDGPHGTAWVIHLTWSKVPDRLESLEVSHLGGYLPWPNGA
jgi:hypothetical protein